MAVDVVMPKMGESIMEGTILTWHKKPGDKVERDETILEISTDKVDTEVPSPESGTITEILYNEGDVVGVGNVIARIDTGNGSVSSTTHQTSDEPKPIAEGQKQEQATQKQVQENNPDDTPVESPSQEKAKSQSGRFYSPLVLNIAKAEGISMAELENITGTGSEGRVTKKDILAFVSNRSIAPVKPESKPIPTEPKKIITPAKKEVSLPRYEVDYNEEGLSVLEFDNIRQKMAEHMVASMSISPHVNCIAECDLTTVDKIRKEMNKDFESKEGFKISYMPFIAEYN